MDESPLFSRPPSPDRAVAEVRIDLPMNLIAVLDALSIHRSTTRKALIQSWVSERLVNEIDGASLLLRLYGSNPAKVD